MKGLRVADFSSSVAGAYCSRLFATTGADVDERWAEETAIDGAIGHWTAALDPGDAASERGFIAVIDQPDVGRRGFPGCPIYLSRTPVQLRPSPPLGEANREIVGPLLGCDDDDVAALERRNVLASLPLYR